MSLSTVIVGHIFGSRKVLGASEFKQKMCLRFGLDTKQYWETVKELRSERAIEINKRYARLLE